MSDTATDKKPEEKPLQPKPELEWVLGNGTKGDNETGWVQFTIFTIIFIGWLACYIWWGMDTPQIPRGMIACFWLYFIWGCVWIRRLPVKRCDPGCYQCKRYS